MKIELSNIVYGNKEEEYDMYKYKAEEEEGVKVTRWTYWSTSHLQKEEEE